MLQQVIIGCGMEGRENKREGGVITKDGEMGKPVLSRRPASAPGTRESTPTDRQLHPRVETRRPRREKTYQMSLVTTGRVKEMLNSSSGLNGSTVDLLYMIQNLGSVSYSLTMLA